MKIIFLGDSLTWGGYGGDFVAGVRRRLHDHEIINAGEGGNTAINLQRRLDAVIDQHPDGVFVMVGGNDAISHSQPATRRYYEQVQKIDGGQVTPEQFADAYHDILTRLHLARIITWVGLAPVEHNTAVLEAMRRYNAAARAVAEAQDVRILDFEAHFPVDDVPDRPPLDQAIINLIGQRTRAGWSDYESAQAEGGYQYTFDGLHITPATAERAADLIVEFLQPDLL